MTGPMMEPNLESDAVVEPPAHGWRGVAYELWVDRMGRIGIITVAVVVLIAMIGPLLAPYDRGAVAGSREGILQPPNAVH
jgi:peptide/nickel transport system permease protein